MLEEGIDPGRFGVGARDANRPRTAVRLVAAGAADAAFAWSSLAGDVATRLFARHAARPRRARRDRDGRLAIVWRSPAIAHGPFAVAKSLPDEEKDRIEEYLLALERSLPSAYDMLNPFYGGGYVAVEPRTMRGSSLLVTSKADRRCPAAPDRGGAPGAPAG